MRTKTLLLSAAAMAAGLVSSVAQSNVYSANVVGYMNLALTNGYNLVAAGQLSVDTSGSSNTVVSVFGTNLPPNSTILAFSPVTGGFTTAQWQNNKGTLKWAGDTNGVNTALQAGQGVFVQATLPATLTVVGNVIQGTNVVPLSPGLQILSSVAPISGGIQTVLGYTPTVGDSVLPFDSAAQGYTTTYSYIANKGNPKWSPSEPVLTAGQAVFIQTTATPAWTNKFVVQ